MTRIEFEQRFLPQWPRMYAVATKMLSNGEDAGDAVQDAFERLLADIDRLDEVDSPQAYCMTMLRRICIDMLRRRETRRSVDIAEAPLPSSARIELPDPDGAQVIEQAIDSLPPAQAQVIKLRALSGLDNSDIAAQTGMNETTVRQQLSRARRKLKEILSNLT